ncbi:putative lipase [Actinoplanes missouriensis 431]|uniref:Putative lipase n=1 Tax=Actinoplanes missouriensis (strain ATCC 14538 / DSM 43046 / CBS 188.64 / JCM 3121 / NBRC 102363 / NCIMB 12654 / NRRL B-3342 / UNCC 431) TaxID=512565 RepID=I0H4P1_ACTM4|nr:putative lipase [Actinoplanes missouriensis 431]
MRALPPLLAGAPRWLLAVAGVTTTALGVLLVVRPLSSLTLLGVYIGVSCVMSGFGDLLARRGERGKGTRLAAIVWILAGVTVLAWLGRSLQLLGPFVALLLLLTGACRLLGMRRGEGVERVLTGVFALAQVAFGLVALLWPDVTLLVVAFLFGVRTTGFGLALLWRAATTAGESRSGSGAGGAPSRLTEYTGRLAVRWVAAAVVLLMAAVSVVVSVQLRRGIPVLDDFYDAPAAVPPVPGRLLRAEPYEGDLPSGLSAQRILYTTTAEDGVPALASAVLAMPTAATGRPMPLIAWAHGTVGVARACAPSLGRDAISTEGMPAMDSLARNGWAMVATDYTGQGTEGAFPYLIGQGEGRSVLDAVRAAHQVDGLDLAGETVIWGHSQGGHAALWAGQLALAYAPELNVVGIAALSAASDPLALAEVVTANPGALGASLAISFVLTAYSRTYPDVSLDDATPAARTLVREAAARCTSEPGTLVTVLTGVAVSKDTPILARDPATGAVGRRLRQNVAHGPWAAPLFIGQGSTDEVIPARLQDDYVARLCAAGRPLRYTRYAGRSHMGVLERDSPLNADLERWTKDRLAGRPHQDDCA